MNYLSVKLLIPIQLAFTHFGLMQTLFATTDMSTDAWLRVVVVASSVLFLVEFEKLILRKYNEHKKLRVVI